ncbi:MAG: alpha/beta hydrolase-fold protein [Candidatus Rifleibacteriota bacterium]
MKYFRYALVLAIFFSFAVSATEVNLVVTVPASTPDGEPVCITGNQPQLSDWNGSGIRLREIGPNLFSFNGDFNPGLDLEFKFTRGSFASVEKTSQGHEKPNRKIRVSGDRIEEKCQVEAWADQIQSPEHQPQITGNYKIIRQFKSKFLKPARDIIVWLPRSYDSSRSLRYPVIYMHDGGNLFDPGTSFGGVDWGVDEAMSEGIENGLLPAAIIVGIANTADRMSEYTPFPDPKHKGGDGENYARFIVEELKPEIDRKFRTLTDRNNTFIGGSSLGGLISLYIGISRPQTFSGIMAISPSIWWANGGIIDWLLKNQIEKYKGRIWVDMGTREGEEAIEFSRKLNSTLREKAPGFKGLVYKEFPGGTHSEGSWKKRILLPLKFVLQAK